MSEEAVKKATDRGWKEWFALLDGAGAPEWKHAEMARWLAREHAVSAWWSQMVTVEYERSRGLRQVHQKANGFAASASKTLPIAVEEFHGWLADAARRRRWLAAKGITVRKSTVPKSVGMTWSDGSSVNATFFAKGEGKSQMTIDHEQLPDAAAVARVKAEWKEALRRLAELVAGGGKSKVAGRAAQ